MAENAITMIPISQLYSHPDNPRKDLGDLTELTESIKVNGIMQNLTVIPAHQVNAVWKEILDSPGDHIPDAYVVLIGHRRMAAAKLVGLDSLPCMVANLPEPKDQISIMLVENMQRSDLTPYEQAQSFQMMLDMGSNVQEISQRSGFSTTTVRQRLKMAELDGETLRQVSGRQIALSDFDRLAQITDLDARNEVLKSIGTNNFNSQMESALIQQKTAAKLPLVKKVLKQSDLKALTQDNKYSSKYIHLGTVRVDEWDEEKQEIPKEAEFYILDTSRTSFAYVSFYQKHQRAKSEPKPPEQIEKERHIREAWDMLKSASAIAYRLRSEFAAKLSVTAKNQTQMLRGAMSFILLNTAYHGPDRDACYRILGADDAASSYGDCRMRKVLNAYAEMSVTDKTILPRIIYAAFADSEKYTYSTEYQSKYPAHRECVEADALYDWLISLGYEMSDDEKALRDGTHPAFSLQAKYDPPKESAQE